jgi:hypothetical protein
MRKWIFATGLMGALVLQSNAASAALPTDTVTDNYPLRACNYAVDSSASYLTSAQSLCPSSKPRNYGVGYCLSYWALRRLTWRWLLFIGVSMCRITLIRSPRMIMTEHDAVPAREESPSSGYSKKSLMPKSDVKVRERYFAWRIIPLLALWALAVALVKVVALEAIPMGCRTQHLLRGRANLCDVVVSSGQATQHQALMANRASHPLARLRVRSAARGVVTGVLITMMMGATVVAAQPVRAPAQPPVAQINRFDCGAAALATVLDVTKGARRNAPGIDQRVGIKPMPNKRPFKTGATVCMSWP